MLDLGTLRNEIDKIDEELTALVLRRMEIVRDVCKYKIQNDLPVLNPAREEEILQQVTMQSGPEMYGYTCKIFKEILSVSRGMQEDIIANK